MGDGQPEDKSVSSLQSFSLESCFLDNFLTIVLLSLLS